MTTHSPVVPTADAWASEHRTRPIVCLCAEPGVAEWFAPQVASLGVIPCEPPAGSAPDPMEPDALDRWVSAAADAIEALDDGVAHVLATGPAALGAVVLAGRRPELVASLLLGDPEFDADAPGCAEQLAHVVAPALVVATSPEVGPEVGAAVSTAQAQRIAGGIDNGVFVIIDGCRAPAHRERSNSFDEWISAFTVIAEGLDALAPHGKEHPDA